MLSQATGPRSKPAARIGRPTCGMLDFAPTALYTVAQTAYTWVVQQDSRYANLEFLFLRVAGSGGVPRRMRQAGTQRSGATGEGAHREKGRLRQVLCD